MATFTILSFEQQQMLTSQNLKIMIKIPSWYIYKKQFFFLLKNHYKEKMIMCINAIPSSLLPCCFADYLFIRHVPKILKGEGPLSEIISVGPY